MDSSVRGTLRLLRRFPILYGVTWALFYAVLGTLGISVWAHTHALSDAQITTAAYVIHCLAVLCGAVAGSKTAGERGWYYGGMTGLCYAVIMVIIGVAVYNTFTFDAPGAFRVLLMALIGACGGIIGVNLGGR